MNPFVAFSVEQVSALGPAVAAALPRRGKKFNLDFQSEFSDGKNKPGTELNFFLRQEADFSTQKFKMGLKTFIISGFVLAAGNNLTH